MRRVEQDRIVDANQAPPRLADSRNGIDDAGLARAGATEQAHDGRVRGERDGKVKRPELLLDVNVDHRFAIAKSDGVSHSDVARATIDRTTAMMLRRNACASPPGT